MEGPLQALVNRTFQGKDPYSVVRSTVVLVVLVRLVAQLRRICSREGLLAYIVKAFIPIVKKVPFARRHIEQEARKVMADLQEKFSKEMTESRAILPHTGLPKKEILQLVATREELDTKHWKGGKISGAVYHGEDEHYEFAGQVYAKWAFANPLHPGIHPALRQMDAEVVQMTVKMYNGGPECCGAFTSGGTESILMAIKAYRDWAKAEKGIVDPNIVVCKTAHAAFDKAGKYFNIFVKHACTNLNMEVDVRHMKSLIDRNTIAIVGSCCQYAHGTIDPIEELAEIAAKRNIGLHVDCCLGGFLVPFMDKAGYPIRPFDFRVKGVTSISCDPHKYGFAPKGSSIVMFSSRQLRHYMYCYLTDWTGGIYATPTMAGSRPGGPIAATWASMCKFGEQGYVETTRQIVGATRKIARGVSEISGLKLVGRPDVCVVAFNGMEGSGVNCYAIADCMKQKFGWDLATCQNPPCIHLALTLPSSKNADCFLEELRQAVDAVKAEPKAFASTAGIYGMAAFVPASLLEDIAAIYIDAMLDPVPREAAVAHGA